LIAAACVTVAILFVAIAVFLWVANTYGTVQACLAMAGFLAAVALIAGGVILWVRSAGRERAERRAAEEAKRKEEEAKNAPNPWLDPSLIPTLLPIGIKAASVLLRHRGLVVALVSSAAVGWSLLREPRPKPQEPVAEPAE
jgi:hypothetical protein